jgi:AbiV family abortive infection protein
MQPRQLKRILEYKPDDRLKVVGEGLVHLAEHVAKLAKAVENLERGGDKRAASVMAVVCTEEAAKILILLDIARDPYDQKAVSRSCDAFYSHTSRGIYAYVHEGNPADFAEVARYVEQSRTSHYLDGPTGADWIFRNDLDHAREATMYVDFMEYEPGDLRWQAPEEEYMRVSKPLNKLVLAMKAAGMLTEKGARAVAEVWKGAEYDATTRWVFCREQNLQVLAKLASADMVDDDDMRKHWRRIADKWTFPLTTLDVRLKRVDLRELEQRQSDYFAREYGY